VTAYRPSPMVSGHRGWMVGGIVLRHDATVASGCLSWDLSVSFNRRGARKNCTEAAGSKRAYTRTVCFDSMSEPVAADQQTSQDIHYGRARQPPRYAVETDCNASSDVA
jgi:hypothetical protein